MISSTRFYEWLLELQAEVNKDVVEKIDKVILSPTEQHMVKKLKDLSGVILAVKMPDSDSEIQTPDSYAEMNHVVAFLFEKVEPGKHSDAQERQHYNGIQATMRKVKEYILTQGLNGDGCGGDETLAKAFRTEWEYQAFGGFNGLSISFDLKDFEL